MYVLCSHCGSNIQKAGLPCIANMPPKAKQTARLANRALCIANKAGRALADAIYYRVCRAPEWIKDYYKAKIAQTSNSTPEQREAFLTHLLTDFNYESAYFTELKEYSETDVKGFKGKWVSWDKFCEQNGEVVATLMVAQKTVRTRPHSKLNHDDPAINNIPQPYQLEYLDTTEIEDLYVFGI